MIAIQFIWLRHSMHIVLVLWYTNIPMLFLIVINIIKTLVAE